MKKIILIITGVALFIAGFIMIKRMKSVTMPPAHYSLGIIQTALHPALDAVYDGFIEELTNTMGNNIAYTVKNAQGSIASAHAIAQQFHANKTYNAFFAIGTPAAQAMHSQEKEKPIIIAAVSDPNAAGLMHAPTTICGVQDMVDVAAIVDLLKQLVPQAKTVGLLYTAGEANSIALVKKMRGALENLGLIVMDFAVSGEADIPVVMELACRKTDVMLAPTDNTVASSISLITTLAHNYKKPLIVSDNMLVKSGALAARGVDYRACGKQAARIAYAVLVEGKKPNELPIEQAQSEQIVINQKTLDALGLTIPESLRSSVITVS